MKTNDINIIIIIFIMMMVHKNTFIVIYSQFLFCSRKLILVLYNSIVYVCVCVCDIHENYVQYKITCTMFDFVNTPEKIKIKINSGLISCLL